MEIISSRSNTKVRKARALRQRKQRITARAFLVEGIHLVGAAVESGAEVREIFYAPDLLKSSYAQQLIKTTSVPCHQITSDVFTSLASKDNPQGILAVVDQPEVGLQELEPENFFWGVACVSPQDPGNIGAILRTIDAVGASGLILLEGGVDVFHPSAVRASMGAIFRHPVVSTSYEQFAEWAAEGGFHVFGSSSQVGRDYRQIASYQRPLILLLGSERQGLTEQQVDICEDVINLPMSGGVTSLNLAVAAGVLLYGILEKLE
jgi:TrmH family RNA methyltransferase